MKQLKVSGYLQLPKACFTLSAAHNHCYREPSMCIKHSKKLNQNRAPACSNFDARSALPEASTLGAMRHLRA